MSLLLKHKAQPEDADSRLERPLHCAARYFASDVAAVSSYDEQSSAPSVVAAARVTSQIGCRAVAFLLQDSMEPERYVNARNVDGETALHIIAETSRDLASAATFATMKALFEAGAAGYLC